MASIRRMTFGLVAGALVASSAAYAAQGETSGPAAGSVVDPHTAIQKQFYEQRSVEPGKPPAPVTPGATGGMPGVEAMPGTEGGRVPPEQIPVR